MAKLTAKARRAIPSKDFAGPDRSYPIENASHARNALARASGKPIEAKVRAAVHRKYPSIGEKHVKDPMPAGESFKTRGSAEHQLKSGEKGLSHEAFDSLDHGKQDHMPGRTVKGFEKAKSSV